MQENKENSTNVDADNLSKARKRIAGATISKMVASAIGDMVTLYSKDPAHRYFSFADMEWKILPPIIKNRARALGRSILVEFGC